VHIHEQLKSLTFEIHKWTLKNDKIIIREMLDIASQISQGIHERALSQ